MFNVAEQSQIEQPRVSTFRRCREARETMPPVGYSIADGRNVRTADLHLRKTMRDTRTPALVKLRRSKGRLGECPQWAGSDGALRGTPV